jgi:hypothetical protein
VCSALAKRAAKEVVVSALRARFASWSGSDNESAVEFYRALGGRPVARSCEKFGENTLDLVAYAWQA